MKEKLVQSRKLVNEILKGIEKDHQISFVALLVSWYLNLPWCYYG